MRILGIDVGDKRIGVAVSDPLGYTAQGVEVIERRGPKSDLRRIADICAQIGVDKIVCGFPRNMNGSVGPQAEKVADFCRALERRLSLPVVLWDERLTTAAAERMLSESGLNWRERKRVVDKTAACLILQSYLDSSCSEYEKSWHGENTSAGRIEGGREYMDEKKGASVSKEMDYDETIIAFEDEDGNVENYLVLDAFELDGKRYAVLTPVSENIELDEDVDEDSDEDDEEDHDHDYCEGCDEDHDEGGVYFFSISQGDDGEEVFADIEDDDEYEKVVSYWESTLDEEED